MSRSTFVRGCTATVAVFVMVVLSACSSSKSKAPVVTAGTGSGSASSSASNSGLEAAKAFIAPSLTQPTTIGITTPLTARPATGKKVFWISTNSDNSLRQAGGLKAAVDALGWTLKILTWTTNPADSNSLMLQAVQQGADFITYQAVPYSVMQTGIAAARAKKIPVFETGDVTPPEGPKNWIFSNTGGIDELKLRGKLAADYAIAKSNGTANILIVTIPSFAVLKGYQDAFEAELSQNCPTCPVGSLQMKYDDLVGGKIPSQIVSYLRSHPKVNNIVFGFGQMTSGFAASASQAGIKLGGTGIQIISQGPSKANLQAIIDGTETAAVIPPLPFEGWIMADAMARQSLSMDLTVNWKASSPLLLGTKDTITSSSQIYAGPTNYEAQFKTLWKIS